MIYIPVAGTHAATRADSFHRAGSLFDQLLRRLGHERHAEAFGFWSTALAGTFFTGSGHLAWQFGAKQLQQALNAKPYADRNLIAHSWGGAVVAYCLADPDTARVRTVITIDTPLQRGLDDIWYAGVKNRTYHEHLYATGWGSRIRFIAQRGRCQRQMPWATRNARITGGHSGLLHHPRHMGQIIPVLDRLRNLD